MKNFPLDKTPKYIPKYEIFKFNEMKCPNNPHHPLLKIRNRKTNQIFYNCDDCDCLFERLEIED